MDYGGIRGYLSAASTVPSQDRLTDSDEHGPGTERGRRNGGSGLGVFAAGLRNVRAYSARARIGPWHLDGDE